MSAELERLRGQIDRVNDEILELHAVLAGRVIGQLAGVTAAPYIRSMQLRPLLVDHIPDRYSYFVYYGSRNAQPARARAFIDLALRRLVDNSEYVMSMKELRAAADSLFNPKKRTRPGAASAGRGAGSAR